MNNLIVLFVCGILFVPVALASNPMTFYGTAHLSVDSLSGTTKDLQVNSRGSRLGVKGVKMFKDDLQGFYQFEFQVDMADNNGSKNTDILIKSRNMFVGIKNNDIGSLIIGRHDTALKKAIGIKVFPDTVAELTSIMASDVGLHNRTDNTLFYKSKLLGPIQVMASISTLENDAANKSVDVQSIAVTYKTKNIYLGFGNERVDAGQKGNRITFGYTFNSGHKIGIGYEVGEYDSGVDHKAYVVNGIMKISDNYKLKATYGKRTAANDEVAYGVGFVRLLDDKNEMYIIYHSDKDDNGTPTDVQTISLGLAYAF